MSDKVIGRRVLWWRAVFVTPAPSGETERSEDPKATGDKDDKEEAAVCSDCPPIRWEQGRNPTKELTIIVEMPSMIEISSWYETATVCKVDRL